MVRWKNYYSIEDTWEPIAQLENCRENLLDFIETKRLVMKRISAWSRRSVMKEDD